MKSTMTNRLCTMAVSSLLLIAGFAAPLLAQGDLTPPPVGSLPLGDVAFDAFGDPTPNMKSLTQTDPGQPLPSKDADLPDLNGALGTFTITVPGHYYLTENLVDKPILVLSPNVTIDLRGYTMSNTLGPVGPAISVGPGPMGAVERVHVRNGFITGPWSSGVTLGNYCSVRDLNVDRAMTFAIEVGGQSTVHNCIVRGNDLEGGGPMPHAGIAAGFGAVVSNSTAREIWGDGIRVDRSSRVVDCTATCNLGTGIVGTESVSISGCTSFMNLLNGYQTGPAASMENCSAHENFAAGFLNRTGSVLSNCTSRQNHIEGYVAMPDVPSDITDYDEVPMLSDDATSYLHCSATMNASDGFLTTINSTYTHCTAVSNGTMLFMETPPYSPSPGDGFDVVDSCRLVNCMASKNGAHGIRAVLDNYIEQNTCHTNALAGIDLAGAGNTVIKNYVKFNLGAAILVGGAPLPAAGVGGVAPLALPSGPGPWNPFSNFFM